MVKSLVSKLSAASSNLSLASTLSSVGGGGSSGSAVQETNYAKHRNDPGRFFGDGVQFKAKLIGILEVGEARGDRMCQEALQDLKMAIRAAGEHKQRITIHVTIDGLRLRDEKTGDSLYHHPVHKISFIAQDMTDSRAFGYIFGSPDSGHRFFGIKTDKAASQVVLAMRDLFQVVFELKKKEIELARQQIQSKSIHEHQLASLSSLKSAAGGGASSTSGHNDLSGGGSGGVGNTLTMLGSMGGGQSRASGIGRLGANLEKGAAKEMSPESVADLVDLEQELSSIQRGITQMERITPSEPTQPAMGSAGGSGKAASEDDPFGDSFTNFPTYNLLPPPESGRSRHKPSKPTETSSSSNITAAAQSVTLSSLLSPAPALSNSPAALQQDDDDNWLHELDQQNDVFDTSKTSVMGLGVGLPMAPLAPSESTSTPTQQLSENSALVDVEATLNGSAIATGVGSSTNNATAASPVPMGEQSQSQTTAKAVKSEPVAAAAGDPVMLPRDTDPFSPTRKKSDPFQEGGDVFAKLDPFEFEFADEKGENMAQRGSPTAPGIASEVRRPTDVFNGPLQVNLPPERGISPPAQWRADVSRLERQTSESTSAPGGTVSTVRSRPTPSVQLTGMSIAMSGVSSIGHAPSSVFKQQTADVISSISNKKMPHLFGQARFSKRDSNSINMRRLQESDSLSENETAPEPPPRPDSASHVEPPPLPPKKQFNDIVIRPRVTSGNAIPPASTASTVSSLSGNVARYEFLNSMSKSTRASDVPPIPLPSRRVGRSDGTYPGPGRPRKPGHTEDDYLAPIGTSAGGGGSVNAGSDVPPLLPPPTQISTRARAQRQQSLSKAHENYENKSEIIQQQQQQPVEDGSATAAIIPDITLSQLLTLGIDELAAKLNVPISKLSTMTLVELTLYLSDFIERSKPTANASAATASPVPKRRPEVPSDSQQQEQQRQSVFKVNFDQQATFVAKFDDTFGEDIRGEARTTNTTGQDTFVANFEQFNEPPVAPPILDKAGRSTPAVPPADRYAVFREIIDLELQHQQENADLLGDVIENPAEINVAPTDKDVDLVAQDESDIHFEAHFDDDDFLTGTTVTTTQSQPPKIDTKITEVVAQAKDRYAALRDIILVENLFDKKAPSASSLQMQAEFPEFGDEFNEDQDLKQIMDDRASSTGADRLGLVDSRGFPAEPSSSALTVEDDDEDEDGAAESSLDSNDKDAEAGIAEQDKYEKLSTSTQQLDGEKSDKPESNGVILEGASGSEPSGSVMTAKQDNKFLTVAGSSGLSSSKDDLEIDELMQRAISNLSLDSRERISPANSTTNATEANTAATTTVVPRPNATLITTQSQFNDVSTSPIPLQKSPVAGTTQPQQQQKSPLSKSPQPSPVLTQLSAVSSLIDTATKQMTSGSDAEPKNSKEFWATFDSPKPESVEKRSGRATKTSKSSSLHLPPPPPSNTSQNDTAESPCSSDPRDEGWSKSGGSVGGVGGGVSGGRRWPKKERHQTSSSSRDLSPWDDELPDYQKQKRIPVPPMPPGGQPPHGHAADRHGYYVRHARRMNSCDEDYDYEDEFSNRRDHRKFKQGLSRSRDNFELESPSWYHHPTHHTWSPQDVEQAAALRARSFDRSAYERTTYGPPIYDKRGIALPAPVASSYDRRSGGYDKRKYYRDYARPNYDFEEYGESPQDRYRETGSFEKLKMGRRSDYENIYDDGRSPMGTSGYKSRGDYMYERDRKSFDRESVESFESATRRRRSFGSGDVYGSLESREDFRDRYMGGTEKTRSLRKGMKLRATGDIDYEQDSENDFHQRSRSSGGVSGVGESRSLQRPSQLSAGGINTAQPRIRKSSGSSPWDGEEPPLPGQKSWKRPSSAADSERRLAESRRAATLGQTPSGSDGEKDRRFRKKQRPRGKDIPYSSGTSATTGSRYGNAPGPVHPARDNYDYITYDDDDVDDEEDYVDEEYDEPPTDEDKFERLNRRRHEMHQRMLESERRQQAMGKMPISSLKCSAPSSTVAAKKYHSCGGRGGEYDFDDYEQTPTPRSNASGGSSYPTTATGGGVGDDNKFSFDGGFESDFNQSSPPPAPAGTASSCNSTPAATGSVSASATPATKSSFRFSNDFSERDKMQSFAQNSTSVSSLQQFDLDAIPSPASHATPAITQKLRFDDNVKVSQFDDAAFEDDFSNAQFDFEKEDQWHAESLPASANAALAATKKHNLRNSKLQQRQELIKKSESINIFAKKVEDPFEDDEFFKSPSETKGKNNSNGNGNGNGNAQMSKSGNGEGNNFQCEDDFNFAKFDENM